MPQLTRGAYAPPASSLEFKTGSWRVEYPVHRSKAAPCHTACPAGENAQAYLARLDEGDAQAAWRELVAANPLPAITGRVCHHPCETACNRGHYDEAIGIHGVERFLGDEAIARGWRYPLEAPASSAPAMAVVGGGPAGLAAAYHLLRLGYRVSLFDAAPEAGGTLRSAIPAYRLPREVLDAEVERVLSLGIDVQAHTALGRDVSLAELRSDYTAVFLGPGNQLAREWAVDFAVPTARHNGLDLLSDWVALGTVPTYESVAIIGGGNTGVDLARVMRRAGVREVHLITHERIPGPDVPADDAMPAIEREIRQAEEEGVVIHQHRGVRRLILRGQRVAGVELVHMKKLVGQDGHLHRVAFEGTETVLHVEQVIPAIGQRVDPKGVESVLGQRAFFEVDDASGAVTEHAGVFAGGDARGDHGTVSEAVGDGRRAAAAMDRYARGETPAPGTTAEPIGIEALNLSYYEPGEREREPILAVERRTASEEIEGALESRQVQHEARRCLSCGQCILCDNCWTLCPDEAVLKTPQRLSDGSLYVFDYDYCKGCGLCARECPTGFIDMVNET